MIDFPIVDTHLHVWNPNYLSYPWLEEIPMLNQPHLLEDYNRATGSIHVEKMVFLQCKCDFGQFMDEAEWVTNLAQEDPRIEGMVTWAPLEKGDAARNDLGKLAANGLVNGVRRIIQFEEDIEFCLQPDFVKGVQALPDYGFSFDICISHIQMTNTSRWWLNVQMCSLFLTTLVNPILRTNSLSRGSKRSRPCPIFRMSGAKYRGWSPKPSMPTGQRKTIHRPCHRLLWL